MGLDVVVEESGLSSFMPSLLIHPGSEQTVAQDLGRGLVVHGKFELSSSWRDEDVKGSLQLAISAKLGAPAHIDSLRLVDSR